jgi:hypothetical protein
MFMIFDYVMLYVYGTINLALVFTAMLMLCSLLWFKEINELIRLFVNLLKVGTFRLSV